MQYMAEFSRDKPLAQCVALSLPRMRFPDPGASPQQIRASYRNWRKQTAVAKRRLQKERLKDLPAGYEDQLADIAAVLARLTPFIALGDDAQSRTAFLDSCASDLMTLGLYAPARQYQSRLLQELTAQNGDALDLAQGHLRMAELLREQPDPSRAREHAQQAQSLFAAQGGAAQAAARTCALFIAELDLCQADVTRACAQAAAVRNDLRRGDADDRALECRALRIQAIAQAMQRAFESALACVQEALAVGQAGPWDARGTTLPKLKVFAGILLRKMRRWDEAETAFREAQAELAALFAPGHLDMGRTAMEAGRLHFLKQDFDQAEEALRQALAIFQPLAHAHLELAIASAFQARLLRVRGKRQRAWKMVAQGLKACAKPSAVQSEWAYRLQLERAYLLFGENKFAAAIPCLQELIARGRPGARDPHIGELHLLLGRAHMEQQEVPAAQAALAQALAHPVDPEDFPLHAHAQLALAEIWLWQGRDQEARRAAEGMLRVLDDAPLDKEWLRGRCAYLVGRSCRATGDLTQALAHFQAACDRLAPDPGWVAECRLWLGDTYLEQGRHGLAIEALQVLVQGKTLNHLRREEDRIKTLYLYGWALSAAGNGEAGWKRVQTAYERLEKGGAQLRASPLASDIRLMTGNLAFTTGRHKTAVRILTALLEEAPRPVSRSADRLAIHNLLGQAFRRLGQYQAARTHFEACLPLALDLHGPRAAATLQVREQLVDAWLALEEPDRAVRELETLLKHSAQPDHSLSKRRWRLTLAEWQYRLGRLDEARNALAQLPDGTPPKEQTQEGRQAFLRRAQLESQIYRASDQPDEAQRVLRQAIAWRPVDDLHPKWADIHVALADLERGAYAMEATICNLRAALALYQANDCREKSVECGFRLATDLWRAAQRKASLRELDALLTWMEEKPEAVNLNARLRLYLTQGQRLARLGRNEEALSHWRRALSVGADRRGSKHLPLRAQCQLEIAAREAPPIAEKRHQWIQREYKRTKCKKDRTLARSCLQYGIILWDRNELQPACDQLQKAHAIFCAADAADAPAALKTRHYLALWHADVGAWDEARTLLQSLLAVPPRALPASLSPVLLRDHWALLTSPGQFPLPLKPSA